MDAKKTEFFFEKNTNFFYVIFGIPVKSWVKFFLYTIYKEILYVILAYFALAFSAGGWIGIENHWKTMKINEKSMKINENQ